MFKDLLVNHVIELWIFNRNVFPEDVAVYSLPILCYYIIKYFFLLNCFYFMMKYLSIYKVTNEMLEDLLQQSTEDLSPQPNRKGRFSSKSFDYTLFLRVEKLKLLKIVKHSLHEMQKNLSSLERVFDNWTLIFFILAPAVGVSMLTATAPFNKDVLIFTVLSNIVVMVTRIYINQRIRGEKVVVYSKVLKLMKTCCTEKFCRSMKRQLTSQKQDKSSRSGFDVDLILLAAILDTACMILLIVLDWENAIIFS